MTSPGLEQSLAFVAHYGHAFVFAVVFVDQLGIPIPTVPILLGLGAFAGTGHIHPLSGLAVAIVASLCADSVWFQLGRWKGTRVLGWLCRIALEPDSCVSKTRDLFSKHGVKSLLIAKFVPGFDTVAPPLAGLLGVRFLPFLLWSAGGALLYVGAFGGLGYLFSDRLEELAATAEQLGGTLVLIIVGLAAAYLGWKYYQRQRVLWSLRMARITPDELNELIVGGDQPVIIDARSRSALDAEPVIIEGALHLTLEDLDTRATEVPRERDVVVYCSCPNEVSAARVALKLKRLGVQRVRPLLGGIEAWQAEGLPVVARQ